MTLQRERELRKQNLTDQLDAYREEVEAKRQAETEKFEAMRLELEQEREQIQYHYDELLASDLLYAQFRGVSMLLERVSSRSPIRVLGFHRSTFHA